jgi:hypothetical protein
MDLTNEKSGGILYAMCKINRNVLMLNNILNNGIIIIIKAIAIIISNGPKCYALRG